MKDLEQDIRSKIYAVYALEFWDPPGSQQMQPYGVVWREGKAKTDVPWGHAVMQLNIPKLGTAMYRISSGFMNCIHKTWCGQCNGCLPFINGSLKWLPLHWRFLHRALSFNLKQVLYIHCWTPHECGNIFSHVISSSPLYSSQQHYGCQIYNSGPSVEALHSDSKNIVNFELHPSSLYPQAWSWHSNQVTDSTSRQVPNFRALLHVQAYLLSRGFLDNIPGDIARRWQRSWPLTPWIVANRWASVWTRL